MNRNTITSSRRTILDLRIQPLQHGPPHFSHPQNSNALYGPIAFHIWEEFFLFSLRCRPWLLLSRTDYVKEQVDIGLGSPGLTMPWFMSPCPQSRYINTVTFDNNFENAPTIVMLHGYGAAHGFFFRNFDALASHFRVIAIDQLGYGASSRPHFPCRSAKEMDAWFIDSLEAWRKAKKLDRFILLAHSFGGYIASKYALKYSQHVQHLVLVGPAGFSLVSEEERAHRVQTLKAAVLKHLWDMNVTPQTLVRILGRWGPRLVKKYTSQTFGTFSPGNILNAEESLLLTDYIYHTAAAKVSGELCLKYLFGYKAFPRTPLETFANDWKVPTSFIYGTNDWMDYKGAEAACKKMKVSTDIFRVSKGGHFVFLDNASAFHSAILHSCQNFFSANPRWSTKDLHVDVTKVM